MRHNIFTLIFDYIFTWVNIIIRRYKKNDLIWNIYTKILTDTIDNSVLEFSRKNSYSSMLLLIRSSYNDQLEYKLHGYCSYDNGILIYKYNNTIIHYKIECIIRNYMRKFKFNSLCLTDYIKINNQQYLYAFGASLVDNVDSIITCSKNTILNYDVEKSKFFVSLLDKKIYVGDYISFNGGIFECNGIIKVSHQWIDTLSSDSITLCGDIIPNMLKYYESNIVTYDIPNSLYDKIDKLIKTDNIKLLKKVMNQYVQ